MPYRVRENLFIGNIYDAAEILQNGGGQGITRVLSVLSSPSIEFFSEWKSTLSIPTKVIKKECVSDWEETQESGERKRTCLPPGKILYILEQAGKDFEIERMGVGVRDMESENLLDHLDVCLDFIERSRKDGSVLVHCFAGVSRSAAVVTAYLMRSERLSHEDALDSLKENCEFVSPNDGFLDQLKMFEDMNFVVDRASPIYKRFRLRTLGDSYNRGEKIEASKFGVDPGTESEAPSPQGAKRVPAYRCRKCRRVVALFESVVDHVPGEGAASFAWNKRRGVSAFGRMSESECSSVFVEPLRWMKAVEEGALEGKLQCVHCDARLGYFNWAGTQCSCGNWITPAFQLHKSRVDVSVL